MSDDEDGLHYNNTHRALLQAFFSRPVLTFEEAKPILAAILSAAHEDRPTLPNDIALADFKTYISTINSSLSPLDYEIRQAVPQNSNDRSPVYALVNTTSDPLTQLATSHTPDEIAFVKRILDAMFETNNTRSREVMAVKSMDALNHAKVPRNRDSAAVTNGESQFASTQGSSAASLTLDRAETVLDNLVSEGWLEKSNAGYFSLSPRALMELRSWLVETYNDAPDEDGEGGVQKIKFCEACREIVTVGQRCSDLDCDCRLHNFCTQGLFRNQETRKCPKCDAEWTGQNFVGEKAARGFSSESAAAGRRRTTRTETATESGD